MYIINATLSRYEWRDWKWNGLNSEEPKIQWTVKVRIGERLNVIGIPFWALDDKGRTHSILHDKDDLYMNFFFDKIPLVSEDKCMNDAKELYTQVLKTWQEQIREEKVVRDKQYYDELIAKGKPKGWNDK